MEARAAVVDSFFLPFARQREQASDFATVLHDHLRYVKKKRQAAVHKSEYEEKLAARQQDDEAEEMSDMSLTAGETMTLNVPKVEVAGMVSVWILSRNA